MTLLLGDCLNKLKELNPNSIDAVITDPPYGLSFMNKHWDYDVPSIEIWKEALRVLKPGGHLLSFGGTRTYHRMVVNIEDAGFEIRDQIQWIYGSGFPKSLDISKAIDKAAGAEREVAGEMVRFDGKPAGKIKQMNGGSFASNPDKKGGIVGVTKPATDAAKQWSGWGTALKPANEPIVLARKPLSEKTVAANVLKWGTGGLNIDATRVGTENVQYIKKGGGGAAFHGQTEKPRLSGSTQGRFPANLILDEAAGEMLDRQSGTSKGTGKRTTKKQNSMGFQGGEKPYDDFSYPDTGGASRFFYCAKASKSERNRGLEGMPERRGGAEQFDSRWKDGIGEERMPINTNHHPTVKPLSLMEYLVKLITPPNGIVLDPFMGSGTTGLAAKNLSFRFVGIERDEEYFKIAEKRIL